MVKININFNLFKKMFLNKIEEFNNKNLRSKLYNHNLNNGVLLILKINKKLIIFMNKIKLKNLMKKN